MNLKPLNNSVNIPSPLDSKLSSLSNRTDIESQSKDLAGRNIAKVAEDFESVFLSLMLKEMRNTLDQSSGGLFGSESSDTYGGMFDMMMGQSLAKQRHLGIADIVEKSVAKYSAQQQRAEADIAVENGNP